MKSALKIAILPLMMLASTSLKSQVLMTLIFGEALNSPKVEFGLIGGFNQSYINDISNAKPLNNFNLGFYFHINMKENSYLSTGVLVKSNVGARGFDSYPIGDPDFDAVFQEAELIKKISYFYVPIQYHYRIKQRFYLEGGVQLGLRNVASDIFEIESHNGDLNYTTDARDQYKRLDAGVIGGAGYKLNSEIKSMSIGISYYYGLMDVSTVEGTPIHNSSMYVFMKIPIGAAEKKSKKKEEKDKG